MRKRNAVAEVGRNRFLSLAHTVDIAGRHDPPGDQETADFAPLMIRPGHPGHNWQYGRD